MGMVWWISCWATYPLKHATTCATSSPLSNSSSSSSSIFKGLGPGFRSAGLSARCSIHLNREFEFDSQRRFYYEVFINLNGDFNGDGKKDQLAKDRKDAISVYFFHSRETGFSPEADLRFSCPEPLSNGR